MSLGLRPYQQTGRDFLEQTERAVLADEPGVGKTPTAIMAATSPALALCPAAIQGVWRQHQQEWRPDLDLTVVSYSALCDRAESERGRREKVLARPRPEYTGPWATVICDEAHYLKERGTKWTQAVRSIKTERLYMLTGTPLPNWGHEVYMLLLLLYPGDPRFTNYWRWVQRWFKVWKAPWGAWEIQGLKDGISWRAFAEANGVPGHWLRRKLDDVLPDLPPLTSQVIETPMTPSQARVYKRLKKEAYATLPTTGAEVVSWSDGGMWGKMLQCSTGLQTLDPGEKPSGSGKMAALAEVLHDRDRPTLVFSHFRTSAEAAGRVAASLGHTVEVVHGGRQSGLDDTIAAFQAGKIQTLSVTFGVMAEGHTLTAADCVIMVERSTKPDRNSQAERRIRRYGQTRPCLRIDLITPDTIDAVDITKLLASKTNQQVAALAGFDLATATR